MGKAVFQKHKAQLSLSLDELSITVVYETKTMRPWLT
jgi:hypothetical protein